MVNELASSIEKSLGNVSIGGVTVNETKKQNQPFEESLSDFILKIRDFNLQQIKKFENKEIKKEDFKISCEACAEMLLRQKIADIEDVNVSDFLWQKFIEKSKHMVTRHSDLRFGKLENLGYRFKCEARKNCRTSVMLDSIQLEELGINED